MKILAICPSIYPEKLNEIGKMNLLLEISYKTTWEKSGSYIYIL